MWTVVRLYSVKVQVIPCWKPRSSFSVEAHSFPGWRGAGSRRQSPGEADGPAGIHRARLLPVCLGVLPPLWALGLGDRAARVTWGGGEPLGSSPAPAEGGALSPGAESAQLLSGAGEGEKGSGWGRRRGWKLTGKITQMISCLPLPWLGLINTRRLIFDSGAQAGLTLSPGALLNVINCESAAWGVCEWHLSPRPSSNIYTVEVQPFPRFGKSFRFVSEDVHLNHCLGRSNGQASQFPAARGRAGEMQTPHCGACSPRLRFRNFIPPHAFSLFGVQLGNRSPSVRGQETHTYF